ncbi:g8878 [Coccomyxa elongata]
MYAQKKPDKVNPEEEKLARWTTCRLSGERLAPPVCADEMGSLYNKSAVVAGLLSKSLPPSLAHISSLRHLIDLKLEPSQQSGQEATKNGATAGSFQMNNGTSFACPLTGLPMNGRYRFSALKKSGHVISEKALKEVPAAVEELVGGKWAQEDVLPLNGAPEEVQQLREHMLLQRAAAKAKKERKKAGKLQAASGDIVAGATCVVPVEHGQAADAAGATGAAGRKRSDTEVSSLAEEKAQVKKFKATETAPKLASKAVWASIFTSSRPEEKETYGCRALSSRGLA